MQSLNPLEKNLNQDVCKKNCSQAWRHIGDKYIYARSKWEANYARYLEFQKQHKLILDWQHEPETFWFEGIKRGCCSYLPDFKSILLDGSHVWYEVKGYYDAKSKTKIKRFSKYFPDEKLVLIDAKWFSKSNRMMRGIIKDWE